MKVLFFASVRERLGLSEWELPEDALPADLAALKRLLAARGEIFREALAQPNLVCSVNQQVVHGNSPLAPGDEIAFFPPVTGG